MINTSKHLRQKQIVNKIKADDEFYTPINVVKSELEYYKEYFNGKVVYCNCDDYRDSNFYKYFNYNFKRLGIKRLYASCYYDPQTSLFGVVTRPVVICDYDGEIKRIREVFGGSYDSKTSVEILEKADIVVTNPPFSIILNFIDFLHRKGKKFIIIGSNLNIANGNMASLYKTGQLDVGVTVFKATPFIRPDGTKKEVCITWYQNIKSDLPRERLPLNNKYDPEFHKKCANADILDISSYKDIPCNYDGLMSVPLTILRFNYKYHFEFVDNVDKNEAFCMKYKVKPVKGYKRSDSYKRREKMSTLSDSDGNIVFARFLIKRKNKK